MMVMLITDPICTPCHNTGEPTFKPMTEPSKYMTYLWVFWKNLPEPNMTKLAAIMIKCDEDETADHHSICLLSHVYLSCCLRFFAAG